MNIAQIETNLSKLIDEFSKDSFIYDLLLAYGIPKATVSLLKKGNRNLSKRDDQVILKKKLFFQSVEDQDLHFIIDSLNDDDAHSRYFSGESSVALPTSSFLPESFFFQQNV